MAGNFFADRVKGNLWKTMDPSYAAGVLLHRRIDSFTDAHPIVREAKQRLDASYGLFRGVLIDVFWDHFLAKDFARHTGGIDPADFTQKAHDILSSHALEFHPRAGQIVEAMIRGNWLLGYASIEGIDTVLKQMGKRFPYTNPLARGSEALIYAYEPLSRLFDEYWPEITSEFGIYRMHSA